MLQRQPNECSNTKYKVLYMSFTVYVKYKIQIILYVLNSCKYFDIHVTVHRDKFCIIKPTRCTNFSNIFYFGMKLYMFRTVPLSMIRSFSPYTQQRYMSYQFVDSLQAGSGWNPKPACKLLANLYDIYRCCVYGEKLLMMDSGNCPKHVEFHSKIK